MKKLLKISILTCAILVLIGLGVILKLSGQFKPGIKYSRVSNAIYLQRSWIMKEKDTAKLKDLVYFLKEMEIKYIYIHHTPFDSNGKLPELSEAATRKLISYLNENYSELKILIWVGGIRTFDKESDKGTFLLRDSDYRNSVVSEIKNIMTEFNFDGVHLNIEPVKNHDPDFLKLLKKLKENIPESKILSIAAFKPYFIRNPDGIYWDSKYYRKVAQYCDQMVVMAYDTNLSHKISYLLYLKYTIRKVLLAMKSLENPPEILIGVPAYHPKDKPAAKVENLKISIRATASIINSMKSSEVFSGIAIYSLWRLDQEEVNDYFLMWIAKNPVIFKNLEGLRE